MFLNKIRNIFCVPDTKFESATDVACAGKRGNICVRNNVSSFPGPYDFDFGNCFKYELTGSALPSVTTWEESLRYSKRTL